MDPKIKTSVELAIVGMNSTAIYHRLGQIWMIESQNSFTDDETFHDQTVLIILDAKQFIFAITFDPGRDQL